MLDSDQWRPTCSIDALHARAEMLAQIRAFFSERGVMEVQTPCLAPGTVTDAHVESIAVPGMGYLQTSPEYQLKRLLAAGAPSLYQIGPAFRAGEVGRLHNPEFTMLEWYRLGYDDAQLMDEVAELVDRVLDPGAYVRVSYAEAISKAGGLHEDPELAFVTALASFGSLRVFVKDFPPEQAALARLRGTPATAARFELAVGGMEIANGYHELGDSELLAARFSRDLQQRRELGRVEPALDRDFLAAMRAGLPECAGVSVGVDRLLMLKLGAASLAQVMPFPLTAPASD